MNNYPTVQPLEVVWLLIGLLGLWRGWPALKTSWEENAKLRLRSVTRGERILGRLYVGVTLPLVVSHMAAVVMAGAAMLIAPSSSASQVTPTGVVITVGLLVMEGGMAFATWWLQYSRTTLREWLVDYPEDARQVMRHQRIED